MSLNGNVELVWILVPAYNILIDYLFYLKIQSKGLMARNYNKLVKNKNKHYKLIQYY